MKELSLAGKTQRLPTKTFCLNHCYFLKIGIKNCTVLILHTTGNRQTFIFISKGDLCLFIGKYPLNYKSPVAMEKKKSCSIYILTPGFFLYIFCLSAEKS